MNHKLGCNYRQFDACVKTGIGSGSAKLDSLVFNFDSPSSGIKPGRSPLPTFSPRRVSCSLSGGLDSDTSSGLFACCDRSASLIRCFAMTQSTPQRTEASPCAVRTWDNRTNGRTAIRKEVLLFGNSRIKSLWRQRRRLALSTLPSVMGARVANYALSGVTPNLWPRGNSRVADGPARKRRV